MAFPKTQFLTVICIDIIGAETSGILAAGKFFQANCFSNDTNIWLNRISFLVMEIKL